MSMPFRIQPDIPKGPRPNMGVGCIQLCPPAWLLNYIYTEYLYIYILLHIGFSQARIEVKTKRGKPIEWGLERGLSAPSGPGAGPPAEGPGGGRGGNGGFTYETKAI